MRTPLFHPPIPPRSGKAAARPMTAVRIIGGIWKRSLLPVVDLPGLRPTPDRVRETVFNWLTHQRGGDLQGLHVLDLFAGTGAMAFEAASRGAARVVLCEQDAKLVETLRSVQARLKATMVEIQYASALTMVQSLLQRNAQGHQGLNPERYDLIFLDPPYRQGWLDKLWPLLPDLLNKNGLIYAEAEVPLEATAMMQYSLEILRADKAGQVFYHLLRKAGESR